MAAQRYVTVVNTPSKLITGGPFLWDVDANPGFDPGGTAMLLSDALAGGYVFPAVQSDNAAVLRGKLLQALDVNAAFLAIASPTQAQAVTQVQRLTREVSALARLLVNALDDTAGT